MKHRLKGWQRENMLHVQFQLEPAPDGKGYHTHHPIMVSGQAEAIWFETGRKRRYGRKHFLNYRRRTRG